MATEKELWKSLFDIQKKLELSDKDMFLILRIQEQEYISWKYSKKVPLDADNAYALISINRKLCKMFKNKKDRIEWLNTKHHKLGLTPLEFMKMSENNILNLQMYLNLIS